MLKSVTVAFSEPGPLDDTDHFFAVADVVAGSVVDVAMLLFPGTTGAIIPKEAWQAISLGGFDDIFHVIEVELPCPGVGLCPHGASKLAYVARNILGDKVGVKLSENVLDVILVSPSGLLADGSGVSPI